MIKLEMLSSFLGPKVLVTGDVPYNEQGQWNVTGSRTFAVEFWSHGHSINKSMCTCRNEWVYFLKILSSTIKS